MLYSADSAPESDSGKAPKSGASGGGVCAYLPKLLISKKWGMFSQFPFDLFKRFSPTAMLR